MAASDSYILYNYTARLRCHISNDRKYTFDSMMHDRFKREPQCLCRYDLYTFMLMFSQLP
jgi:hypothetical protein